MRGLISFFTRIPAGGTIDDAVDKIWLLPFLGIVTAAIPTVILYLKPPLTPILSLILFYLITGIIHLDGLADFSDGMMVKGNAEEKIRAMKGVEIGTAGIFAVIAIILLQLYSLERVPVWSLIVAEINSKMSMSLLLYLGKPIGDGIGRYFIEKMSVKKFLLSLSIYILFISIFSLFSLHALISILSLSVPFYILRVAEKNLGGINGDCIGASAEITRAVALASIALLG